MKNTNIMFSPEQDQYLQLTQTRAYYQGIREGIERYAHWNNGTQYVGTTGRSLREAINSINQEESEVLSRFTVA
jgi:predicted heme/steroid binding protein